MKKGLYFALAAAAINGTIGVASKYLLLSANPLIFTPALIAWLKTIFGLIGVASFLWLIKQVRTGLSDGSQNIVKNNWFGAKTLLHTGLAAFTGMFMLFYFETSAYQHSDAAPVVVILMSVGCITALLGSWVLLQIKPSLSQWGGIAIASLGIAIMTGVINLGLGSISVLSASMSLQAFLFACLAGIGYGLFTVLLKRFNLAGGLVLTRQLLLFAAIFLSVPVWLSADQHTNINTLTALPNWSIFVWLALIWLAVVPSILGFYCTTRAVDLLPPAKVQILELTEPVFTAAFAALLLGEHLSFSVMLGGAVTLAGIYWAHR